jgi:hypothetical protein
MHQQTDGPTQSRAVSTSASSNQPAAQSTVEPEPSEMRRHVEALSRLLRNPAHMEQLNQAADYIRREWEKMGFTVTEQPVRYEGKDFKNLLVSYGPPQAERIVIGAHYDAFGDQPGADDNASGIAGILELSRLLSQYRPALKNRIDLVAYTLEELRPEAMGSKTHAESLVQEKAQVRGMISVEMIGYYDDRPGSQTYPLKQLHWVYPNTGDFIGLVGYGNSFGWMRQVRASFLQNFEKTGILPTRMLYVPFNTIGVDRSDHSSYSRLGIPAMMVTDTSNFRNPNYHSRSDTLQTLDFQRAAEVVKMLYNFAVGESSHSRTDFN